VIFPISTPDTRPATIAMKRSVPVMSGPKSASEPPVSSHANTTRMMLATIMPRNSAEWILVSSLVFTKKVPTIEARMPAPDSVSGSATRLAFASVPTATATSPRLIAAMIEPT
jgi:hypothetical protein